MSGSAIAGERVGAIFGQTIERMEFFGYGIYEGDKIPDPRLNVMFLGAPVEHPNPSILLDSGERVYGCECWWGEEEAIKKKVASHTGELVMVTPTEVRLKYNRD